LKPKFIITRAIEPTLSAPWGSTKTILGSIHLLLDTDQKRYSLGIQVGV